MELCETKIYFESCMPDNIPRLCVINILRGSSGCFSPRWDEIDARSSFTWTLHVLYKQGCIRWDKISVAFSPFGFVNYALFKSSVYRIPPPPTLTTAEALKSWSWTLTAELICMFSWDINNQILLFFTVFFFYWICQVFVTELAIHLKSNFGEVNQIVWAHQVLSEVA